MKKALVSLIIVLLLNLSLGFAQTTVKSAILFDYDKFFINQSSQKILDSVYAKIKYKKIKSIIISGHTDSDGSDAYNVTLSENRAKTASDFFTSKGISKSLIKLEYFGEGKPIATNDDAAGKQKNRRSEISIEYGEAVIADVFTDIKKESQFFNMLAENDIEIEGKEGTKIFIPANSLVNQTGALIKGEVSIELKEFYSVSDMISNNLNTTSGTDLLETAGMIFIDAAKGTEKLKLAEDAKMEITFKNKTESDNMNVFLGEKINSKINWVQQKDTASLNNSEVLSEKVLSLQKKSNEAPVNGVSVNVSGIKDRRGKGMSKINGGIVSMVSDSLAQARDATFNALILRTNKLGWINCDRFSGKKNITNLIVHVDPLIKPRLRLVFKSINSIMDGAYLDEGNVMFSNVPVGKKAVIIGYSMVDDLPYYGAKPIEIARGKTEILSINKTTMNALADELQKLNK